MGAIKDDTPVFNPDTLARMIKEKFQAKPAVATNVLSLLGAGMQLYQKR
jgi:indolepyruvate ferredoxin oxidoreductase beta subunit